MVNDQVFTPRREYDVPVIVKESVTGKKYRRGKFLGRGGFAVCYELIDNDTGRIWAGKVIPKSKLVKENLKQKAEQEIVIHKSVGHKYVVEFKSHFDDEKNRYFLLELCKHRSLMEMQKRRDTLTEPEIRYFTRQIAEACHYLHKNNIVHRDLKLGNLFLSEQMDIKVGDFGLATKFDGRRMTLCGTPNYISPEVLLRKGHDSKVDVWALGCIVYTLAVGHPPFECTDLKETYNRIKHCQYDKDKIKNPELRRFIERMLKLEPTKRPTMREILEDPYLNFPNFIPKRLPVSALTIAPAWPKDVEPLEPSPLPLLPTSWPIALLNVLARLLENLINTRPNERQVINMEDAEDPASGPIFWVSKWVDYTDKYGFGYTLCNDSVGVLFNDLTQMLVTEQHRIQCIQPDGRESFFTMDNYPQAEVKKVTLLRYFNNYMNEHLEKLGVKPNPKDGDESARLPYLHNWFRTKHAVCFHLNNGIVQINFTHDHRKLILCPLMKSVTFVDENREFKTYTFSGLQTQGCSTDLIQRLGYAVEIVKRFANHKLLKPEQSPKQTPDIIKSSKPRVYGIPDRGGEPVATNY